MSEQPNTDVNQSYYKNNRYNDKGNGHHRHRDYNHRPRGSSHNNYHRDNSGQNAENTPSNNPQHRFKHFEKSIDEYDKIEKLGEGTYGEVFKAKHSVTGDLVAIKKVRMDREKEGFPITAIREISILKTLNNENIVRLKDVIASKDKGNFFMVFEYIEHDLAGLLDAKIPFSECEIKSIVHQLLSALFHCHSQNILHRDLKASNLLITRQGTLKLADFGLSRFTQKGKTVYTNRVITRWYRPPELLLGAVDYGPKIDMWSVGCILGELLHPSKKAVFPAKTEVEQLDLVFSICGTPTEQTWPGVEKLPGWKDVVKSKVVHPRTLREKLFANNVKWSKEAIDLLDKLLSLDPAQRPSASECLDHDWFWKNGKPTPPRNLPEKSINELSVRTKKIPTGAPSQPNGSGQHPLPANPHPQQHRPRHHNGPNHPPPHDPSVEPPHKRHKTGGYRGPPNGSHQGPPQHSNDRGHYKRREDDRRDDRRGPPPEKRE